MNTPITAVEHTQLISLVERYERPQNYAGRTTDGGQSFAT
jgi:hypothetical protein